MSRNLNQAKMANNSLRRSLDGAGDNVKRTARMDTSARGKPQPRREIGLKAPKRLPGVLTVAEVRQS